MQHSINRFGREEIEVCLFSKITAENKITAEHRNVGRRTVEHVRTLRIIVS